jgi:GAF domain-containing protein
LSSCLREGDSERVRAPEVPVSLRSWMTAVGEITSAVNAAEPLVALLGCVARQACALIGFEYCAVLLADPTGVRLEVAGSSGLTADYVALVSDGGSLLLHPSGPALDTPAARAYREHRTVAVPDVHEAPDYGRLPLLAQRQGYRALLAAPLRTAAGQSGVLVGYSVVAREFSRTEQELVELLADQGALALENARLRSAEQAVIGELSRANEELRRRRAALEWSEQQHRALMELALADVGLGDLVASLADTLHASVTVEDAEGATLARAPERNYRPPPGAAARRRLWTRAGPAGQTHGYEVVRVPVGGPGRPGPAAVGHPLTVEPGAWVAPVVLGGELVGRLWVIDPRVTPAPVERRVIERFALVVGMELLKRRHLADAEARLAGDLIGQLLRPGGPEDLEVIERAAALGHDLTRLHVVAVLTAAPALGPGRGRELVRAASDADGEVLAGPYAGGHVLLVPADPDPVPLLRRTFEQVRRAVGSRGVVTMVAGPSAGPGGHAEAYRIAVGAARLRGTAGPGGFLDVRELGLTALLLESGTPEALRRFADRLLGPVAAHDARRGGDLVPTLRAWLAVGCSAPAAAAALVVHPNTVAYRLARVEQLIGRSLRRPDTRLELQLALTVDDVAG